MRANLRVMALLAIICMFCPRAFSFLPATCLRSRYAFSLDALATCEAAKASMLDTAKRLKQKEGILVSSSQGQSDLNEAVSELEAVSDPPTREDYENYFQGDWKLVCTTASLKGVETPDRPQFLTDLLESGPLADLKDSLTSRLQVLQRIRSEDRIDHVLEYAPPDKLEELFPGSTGDIPEALSSLNLNPLQVSQSKVTLIHKATVESVEPVLRTKLGLESVVLSVAGNSQVLDPKGADVLGLNFPLGEFLNTGSFDTTYMDADVRISRGKVGLLEQLRVFVKEPNETVQPATEDESDVVESDETVDSEVVIEEESKMEPESASVESVIEAQLVEEASEKEEASAESSEDQEIVGSERDDASEDEVETDDEL